ncbi:MAG: hypothetical protein ACSLEY_01585 [Candidatus Saccharimonadales bacterium]
MWAFLSWWYGDGWRQRARLIGERLIATLDYFSIDLLLKTLFAPFRQISAGKIRGSLDIQLRAFFDQLISRLIGGFVRLVLIVVGSVWLVITALIGGFILAIWGFLPLLPLVGIIVAILGWVP